MLQQLQLRRGAIVGGRGTRAWKESRSDGGSQTFLPTLYEAAATTNIQGCISRHVPIPDTTTLYLVNHTHQLPLWPSLAAGARGKRSHEREGGLSRERHGAIENEGNRLVYLYQVDSDPSAVTLSCTDFNEEVVMHLSKCKECPLKSMTP